MDNTFVFDYPKLKSYSFDSPQECADTIEQVISEILMAFTIKIKQTMQQNGVTLDRLSGEIGITRGALSNKLKREFGGFPEMLIPLANFLYPAQTLDDIIYGTNFSMPLPGECRLFLSLWNQLNANDRRSAKNYMDKNRSEDPLAPYSLRIREVFDLKGRKEPTIPEFTEAWKLTDRTWRYETIIKAVELNKTIRPRISAWLRFSIYTETPLEYLLKKDYSGCKMYYEYSDSKFPISKSDSTALRPFLRMDETNKAELLAKLSRKIATRTEKSQHA